MVELRPFARNSEFFGLGYDHRQGRVIGDDLLPHVNAKSAGDPFHLWMPPRARSKILQLPSCISRIKPGKPRCKISISLAPAAVAGRTSPASSGFAATESDQLAAGLEGIGGNGRRSARRKCQKRESELSPSGHIPYQSLRIGSGSPRIVLALATVLAAMTAACKQPPDARHDLDKAAIERGSRLVAEAGCTACHAFPGIAWPRGRAGPSLLAFDGRGPIAGALSNTPANLAAFVRIAPAIKPGSPMPAMPLSRSEARDVATYLYGIADD